jgi:hypothetical protein
LSPLPFPSSPDRQHNPIHATSTPLHQPVSTTPDTTHLLLYAKAGEVARRTPVEQALITIVERYLESRAARFPVNTKRQRASASIAVWPATAALFVGSGGERITRDQTCRGIERQPIAIYWVV